MSSVDQNTGQPSYGVAQGIRVGNKVSELSWFPVSLSDFKSEFQGSKSFINGIGVMVLSNEFKH